MANDQLNSMERATVELLWDYLKRDNQRQSERDARGWLTWLTGEWIKDELNETPVRLSSVIREWVTA